ncbi:hypothetical protein PT974_12004 [Cladobotryum mycophilum]|uniref:F-box domain-containing protein n=1 Tax=Cladobotryum mycophilum TaxID=491253 RepID=A0ABR0S6T0_9HYPO
MMEAQLERVRLQSNTYQQLRMTDNTLDDAKLEIKCPLDNGRHSSKSELTLGLLERLPSELVVDILVSLDLQSLTTFRRVSRQAMSLVDSLHEYAQVVEHCPNVLRAILSINALSYDSRVLFRALSSVKCASCNRFGNYLYLITCKRVCYYCFTTEPDFLPMPAFQAGKHTGLSGPQLMSIAHVVTLPGHYAQGEGMRLQEAHL